MEQTHRIDWFDGTECVQTTPAPAPTVFPRGDDVTVEEPPLFEMKLMGFRRLAELAESESSAVLLTLSGRTSFWRLLESELKPDFIVLIAKVLCRASEGSPVLARPLLQRAFASHYPSTLLDYLRSLPTVRLSEKRHNMELWRDAEGALAVVLNLCAAACRLLPRTVAAHITPQVLSAAQAARTGLAQHHAETFSSSLLQLEEQTATQIALLLSSQENRKEQTIDNSTANSESIERDYRSMSVLPTAEDLRDGTRGAGDERGHKSGEGYLCEQFHRLREDYIAPLRRAVCQYCKDPSSKSDNIRLLGEGCVIGRRMCGRAGHVLHLSRSNVAQLTHGSLLLLTADNWRTVLAATVLQSIDRHHVCVSLHGVERGAGAGWRRWGEVLQQQYAVWESVVYVEPYRRVLRALQLTEPSTLPFTSHLVHLQREVAPPAYLGTASVLMDTLSEAGVGADCLDDTQLAAYRHALTHSLALIQGPPGTGKTHTGLQIARSLLAHAAAGVFAGPLLIVCYTNRALDHFLERLLPHTTDVVRLGGQSESELLKPYTMSELRARCSVRSKAGAAYSAALRRQQDAVKRIDELIAKLHAYRRQLLPYSLLEPYLLLRGRRHTLRCADDEASCDPVHSWLFQHLRREKSKQSETEACGVADSWEDVVEDHHVTTPLHSTDTDRRLLPEELECLQMYMEGDEALSCPLPDGHVTSLYELSAVERWSLYVRAMRSLQQQWLVDIAQLESEVKECGEQLKELSQSMDVETVRSARVLGATTTGAARHRPLLLTLRPPVLLVEEAAEVLEAHILAALTPHCQHLILIGDHLQLRPHTAEHNAHNSLAVSLPERLMCAGMPSVCLKTQRRMRSELLALISPLIYADLVTHPIALHQPSVRGLHKNLFFLTHQSAEERHSVVVGADGEGWSVRNTWEAEWSCTLAAHLRRQDYSFTHLVILTPYTAQARLIQQMSKDYPLLEGVRITTVDNFQGEESGIVILSLVRCNKNGDIGFLAMQNRVCVALSRAKEGLYMLGDMSTLCARSSLWCSVRSTLTQQAAIDDHITLQCHNHPHRLTQVRNAAEIASVSSHGGCDEACGAMLACGHRCQALCHAYDAAHTYFTCAHPCERKCRRGHTCPLRCGEVCGACSDRTKFTLSCGHTVQAPCFIDDASTLCCTVCAS